MPTTQKKSSHRILIIIRTICIIVFCVSLFMIIAQQVRERRERREFEKLLAQVQDPGEIDPDSLSNFTGEEHTPDDYAQPNSNEGFHKYDLLYEQNHDLFGWISIDDTVVNYPVMYTPNDPEYYLRRDFNGKYAVSGVPFMDGNCFPDCGNYILYGHHMKNGSMFAILSKYADEEFYKEHPIVHFDTIDEPGDYEIMAAFYGEVYRKDDTSSFHFYSYTDLTGEASFRDYVSQVQKASLYDTGITAEYGDQLLTLITCSYHTTNGRFVVVARKIREEQSDQTVVHP